MTCLQLELGSSSSNTAPTRRHDPLSATLAFPGCHTSIRRPVHVLAGRGPIPAPGRREKHFRAKIGRMRLSKSWRDLGDLKRELLDLWTEERNAYAKEVMTDIQKQRREAAR